MPNPIPTEPPQPRDPGPTADLYDSTAYAYLDEAALTRYARGLEKELKARDAEVARYKETAENYLSAIHKFDSDVARLEAENEALSHQLEHDRTLVADCIAAANKAIDSRHWLTEGRGSYEWNDDRWYGEFRAAALEIKAAIAPMTRVAADWTGCPLTRPEIVKARIDLTAESRTLAAQVVAMRAALELTRQRWKSWPPLTTGIAHEVHLGEIFVVVNAALALPATDAEKQVAALVQAAQRFAAFDLDEGDLRLLMISLKATGLSAEDDSYAKRYGEIRDEVRAALAPFGGGK